MILAVHGPPPPPFPNSEAALLAQFVPEDPKANLDQRVAAAACYAIASLSEGLVCVVKSEEERQDSPTCLLLLTL